MRLLIILEKFNNFRCSPVHWFVGKGFGYIHVPAICNPPKPHPDKYVLAFFKCLKTTYNWTKLLASHTEAWHWHLCHVRFIQCRCHALIVRLICKTSLSGWEKDNDNDDGYKNSRHWESKRHFTISSGGVRISDQIRIVGHNWNNKQLYL